MYGFIFPEKPWDPEVACRYRKRCEWDDQGLCRHCYGVRPEKPAPPQEDTQPMNIPVSTRSRPPGVPAHAHFVPGGPFSPDCWAWIDQAGTTNIVAA
jgi:hypothetical protein